MTSKPHTLPELFADCVKKNMHRPAVSFVDETPLSYIELNELQNKISFWLASQGVSRTDKVAILGENSPFWVATFLAITCMGAIAVPILPDFSAKEVSTILEHSDSKFLFISKRLHNRHEGKLVFPKEDIVIIDEFYSLRDFTSILQYAERAEYAQYKPEKVEPSDISDIIYTSGTTGRPKGVMLTHKALVQETEKVLLVQDVNDRDLFLSLLPLSHVYENVLGMLLPLRSGALVCYISKPPTPAILMDAMQKMHPTMILAVPLIIEKIYNGRIRPQLYKNSFLRTAMHITPIRKLLNKLAGKKLQEAFGGRLRFLGIGGAALSLSVERFLRDAKIPYSCGYGLTETSSLIFGSPVTETSFQTVGKPLQGLNYRLVKSDENAQEGEVVVQWDSNMVGYYKDPEMTDAVLQKGNWFHTGDLATIKDGNLSIKGRSKTMILGPSGENIYPEEIESVLNHMEGVVESLVLEVKGKLVALVYLNKEELAKKYYFFRDEADQKSTDAYQKVTQYMAEMRHHLNDHLSKFSQVSTLEIVDEPFDKTPTHKIKRHKYRKE